MKDFKKDYDSIEQLKEELKNYFKSGDFIFYRYEDEEYKIFYTRSLYEVDDLINYFVNSYTDTFTIKIFKNWDIEYEELCYNSQWWNCYKLRRPDNYKKDEMIKIIKEHIRDEAEHKDLLNELKENYKANKLEDLTENELQTLMYDILYNRYFYK